MKKAGLTPYDSGLMSSNEWMHESGVTPDDRIKANSAPIPSPTESISPKFGILEVVNGSREAPESSPSVMKGPGEADWLREHKARRERTGNFMSKLSMDNLFEARFLRYSRGLYFIACRILNKEEGAEEAVRNCFLTASQAASQFHDEGAFKSWLFRVLIDEALLIRWRKIS